jgi:tetratricopeptide (TPR) repeat protein
MKKKYIEASLCFNRILIHDQQSHEAWAHKGLSLNRAGYIIQSLQCLDKAIAVLSQLEYQYDKELEQREDKKVCFEHFDVIQQLAYTREIKNRIMNGTWNP